MVARWKFAHAGFACVATIVCLGLIAPPATAGRTIPTILVSPAEGPPTTRTMVTGVGFGPSEMVVVRFDRSALGTVMTTTAGRVTKKITVPPSAKPGPHVISATGTTSGSSARAPFTVRTDWTEFGFDLANTNDNPYENV